MAWKNHFDDELVDWIKWEELYQNDHTRSESGWFELLHARDQVVLNFSKFIDQSDPNIAQEQWNALPLIMAELLPTGHSTLTRKLVDRVPRYHLMKQLKQIQNTLKTPWGADFYDASKKELLEGQLKFQFMREPKASQIAEIGHSRGCYHFQDQTVSVRPAPFQKSISTLVHELSHHWDPELYSFRVELTQMEKEILFFPGDFSQTNHDQKILFARYWFLKTYGLHLTELVPLLKSCQVLDSLVRQKKINPSDLDPVDIRLWGEVFEGRTTCHYQALAWIKKYFSPIVIYHDPKSLKGQWVEEFFKLWAKEQGFEWPLFSPDTFVIERHRLGRKSSSQPGY